MPDLIHAPWTPEQVTALKEFQEAGGMHPFTCGALHASGRSPELKATRAGWVCPDPACGYTQEWAHAFMADPTAWPQSPFGGRHGPTPQEVAAAVATVATEMDKSRRYLRPVRAYEPGEVHLATYEWLPMFDAWATGPGLCGRSMRQGPLPEGTVVTCSACLEWQPKYERMLAPGYRPEDDDPDVLRARAETAEQQVQAAQAEVDRLATELYWAQDAHAFVGEMCDLFERKQDAPEGYATLLTSDVREWLKGPRCIRVAAVDGSTVPARAEGEGTAGLLEAFRLHVRAALEASGRSQASVARELEVSTKHLNQMLQGHSPLTLEWADRILRACGMRIVVGKAGQ